MRNLHLQSLEASELPLEGGGGGVGVHVELFCVNPAGDGCLYVATSDGEVVCLSRDGGKVSDCLVLPPPLAQQRRHYLAWTSARERNCR